VTALSSTTMIRYGPPGEPADGGYARQQRRGNSSQQADLLELRLDDIGVERLHDVLVRPGTDRFLDMADIVFGSYRRTTTGAPPPLIPRRARKNSMPFITGMFQSSRMASGMRPQAGRHRKLTVGCLLDGEVEFLEDSPDEPFERYANHRR